MSRLRPYFPAPFGDMMITGCFGLLAAVADLHPEFGDPIRASLAGGGGRGTPPWEIDCRRALVVDTPSLCGIISPAGPVAQLAEQATLNR